MNPHCRRDYMTNSAVECDSVRMALSSPYATLCLFILSHPLRLFAYLSLPVLISPSHICTLSILLASLFFFSPYRRSTSCWISVPGRTAPVQRRSRRSSTPSMRNCDCTVVESSCSFSSFTNVINCVETDCTEPLRSSDAICHQK